MKSKFYLLIVCLACATFAQATHFAGADFYYRYIGDSTNIPNHYQITYVLLRDVSGSAAPQNIGITAASSCFPNQTATLPRDLTIPVTTLMNLGNCVQTAVPAIVLEKYVYSGTIVLSGSCADWTFSTGTCCWNTTTNFVGQPVFFSKIKLNNTLGTNSSPEFNSFPLMSACAGQKLKWSQSAIELEADSVRFAIVAPLRELNASVNFQPAYSASRPFSTNTPSPLLDATTGMLEFQVGNALGAFGFSVDVENWRFIPAANDWVLVGTSNRTSQLFVVSNCAQQVVMGPQLDFTRFPNNTTGERKIQGFCNDSTFSIHFQGPIDCGSISADGSEFRLLAPSGAPIPVIGTTANCNPLDQTTQELLLHLGIPLVENGSYFLTLRIGNDGDLFTNDCGFSMLAQAPVFVEVNNCPPTTFSLEGHLNTHLQWGAPTPNPASDWIRLPYHTAKAEWIAIEVTNMAGQIIMNTEVQLAETAGHLEFSTAQWPSGIFVMTISAGNKKWQKKILVH